MTKTYIINTLSAEDSFYGPRLVQKWVATTTNKDQALNIYDAYASDLSIFAAYLAEWQPGSNGGSLEHHNYASLNCTGGVPKQIVIKAGDRSCGLVFEKNKYAGLDDWSDATINQPISSNRLRLSAKKLTEEQKQCIGWWQTKPINEGRFIARYNGLHATTVVDSRGELIERGLPHDATLELIKNDLEFIALIARSTQP